jgi:Flp pilus assembly protein TadD
VVAMSRGMGKLGEALALIGHPDRARMRMQDALWWATQLLGIHERNTSDKRNLTNATRSVIEAELRLVRLLSTPAQTALAAREPSVAAGDRTHEGEARQYAEDAIELAEGIEQPPGLFLAHVLSDASAGLDRQSAAQALNRALALARDRSGDANLIGWILLLAGRFGEADAHFTALVQATPSSQFEYPYYVGNLANARLLGGKVEDAVRLVRLGTELREDFAFFVANDLAEFRRRGFSTAGFEAIEALLK